MRAIPGKGWLVANIADRPATVSEIKLLTQKISQWCQEQFGELGVRWYVDPNHSIHLQWRFRDESDFMMFLMVWE